MAATNMIMGFLAALATFNIHQAAALKQRHGKRAECDPKIRSIGCWLEGSTGGRLLSDDFLEDDQKMTVQLCSDFCTVENNHTLFGVEYGSQCFCGNEIQPGSGFPADNIPICNQPCVGDFSQTCGGRDAIYIYQALPPPPAFPPGLISNYTYTATGCYAEPSDGTRALDGFLNANPWQSSSSCARICGLSDYKYFGLEYGDECWCGNNLSPLATLIDPSQCSMACAGNVASGANETCGGPSILNLYTGNFKNQTQLPSLELY